MYKAVSTQKNCTINLFYRKKYLTYGGEVNFVMKNLCGVDGIFDPMECFFTFELEEKGWCDVDLIDSAYMEQQ